MKRFLALGLIMTLIIGSTIGLFPIAVVAADDYQFSAGDGSPGNPYVVMTTEDLDHVRDNLAANYILGADIDLSSYSTGEGWEPIGEDVDSPFTGTFDGNDYLIRNLFIDRDITYSGLFGYAQNATLQNIRLLDVDITGSVHFLGSLVGFAHSTEIIDSSVSSISAPGINNNELSSSGTGGLVGYVVGHGAAIKNSYASIDVSGIRAVGGLLGMIEQSAIAVESSFALGNVTGSSIYAGGLAADFRSSMYNSYAAGNVVGARYVGGLVGNTVLSATALNSSFQTGTVTGTQDVGRLLGRYNGTALVTDLIYNSSVNETLPEVAEKVVSITGYQGLSDEDMKTRAAYGTILDFDSVWGINEGISYPYLRVFTPIVRVNDSLQHLYKENDQLVLDGFVMDGSIGEAVEVSYTITNSSNTPVASGSEVLVSATEDIQMYSFSETLDTIRFPQGTYTAHVTAEDLEGHQAREQTVTFIVDQTAPVITLTGANPLQHEVGTTFNDPGATALDTVDGDVTLDITVSGSVDSNTVGSYTLTYTVTDAAGNEATRTRTVNVVDTVAPVITLIGANPLQHEVGTTYNEPGATALDTVDGDVTLDITVSGNVDSNTAGSYTLTYSVTDSAGNEGTITRTVNVVDTIAPLITLIGASPLQHEVGTAYTDLGATALDAGDGDVTPDITVSGSVDITKVGSYTLTYSVTDAAGNIGTATRTVNVIDTTAPVITLNGSNPHKINAGSLFRDPGATAVDVGDGDLTSSITVSGTVDSNTIGDYTLVYEAADQSGNVATATRTVKVTRGYEVASGDTRLEQLTVLAGGLPKKLTPAFTPEVTEYRIETTGEQVELTLRSADTNATVLVQQLVDGKVILPVAEGTQTITVTVRAENGSLRNYNVIITRTAVQDNATPLEETCQFTDIEGHWAEAAICQAASLNIVEGLSKTIFAPNQSVTRAEFAVMLLRTLKISSEQQESDNVFSDGAIIPQWAQAAIMTGVDKGVLHGYPDGTFRPLQVISRVEMAAMLAKALNWDTEQTTVLPFVDASRIPSWSLAYVEFVYSNGLLQGRSGNQFAPNEVTTRAEAAVVMLRLWQLLQQL